jgi:hypothetical protein
MIESVETLESVLEPYPGQTVYCQADKKDWRWDPIEGWQDVSVSNTTLAEMSAYEINKQIISQLPNLSNKDLKEKTKLITKFISETNHKYYMLLCRELNYYTILANDPINAAPNDYFGDVLLECLAFWHVKAIDVSTETDIALEIWIAGDDDEVNVMYFFPYDNGVIACR